MFPSASASDLLPRKDQLLHPTASASSLSTPFLTPPFVPFHPPSSTSSSLLVLLAPLPSPPLTEISTKPYHALSLPPVAIPPPPYCLQGVCVLSTHPSFPPSGPLTTWCNLKVLQQTERTWPSLTTTDLPPAQASSCQRSLLPLVPFLYLHPYPCYARPDPKPYHSLT